MKKKNNQIEILILSIIMCIGIFAIIYMMFGLEIKHIWVEDSYLYGDEFCNNNGNCVSTVGHQTYMAVTLYELKRYEYWRER